jgi:molybdopterin-guanine dinucleotide biosynthesis protein A
MDMQHGYEHAAWTFTCSSDMQYDRHRHTVQLCSIFIRESNLAAILYSDRSKLGAALYSGKSELAAALYGGKQSDKSFRCIVQQLKTLRHVKSSLLQYIAASQNSPLYSGKSNSTTLKSSLGPSRKNQTIIDLWVECTT